MFDVIIVGGGPAGASAAYSLSQSGISCILLDRAKFPRAKLCGGGITLSVTHNDKDVFRK